MFMGRDGYECEEFIRAIHRVAYAAGKIRDHTWMADLALACFSGKALRYYDSLEPEVQCDWRLLRRALLTKYPRPDGGEDKLPFAESSMLQTSIQMARLGPPPRARTGRIKVIGANSSDYGYLGYGSTASETGLGAGASVTEALSFHYTPARELFELEIERSDGENQVLGMHWDSQAPSVAIGSPNFATLAAFNYEGSFRSSTTYMDGPGHTRIWKIMPDNTLCPHMEGDVTFKQLHFFVFQSSDHPRHSIDVAADAGVYMMEHGPRGWTLVKLFLEPIS